METDSQPGSVLYPSPVPNSLLEASIRTRRPPRFFLSHCRDDVAVIAALQRVLKFRGLHAWRDTDDLDVGEAFEGALRRAIREDVSAFIALVTPAFLTRPIIWNLEVPEALARRQRDPGFLIVPIFCGVTPAELTGTCEAHGLADMSAFNGQFLPPRAVRRTRDAALRGVGQKTLRAGLRPRFNSVDYVPRLLLRAQAFTGGNDGMDLDLDWTAPFQPGCPTSSEWEVELLPALQDVKDVLQELSCRRVHVEVQSRLSAPLAFGEVFSATSKFTLFFSGGNGAWSTDAPRRGTPVLTRTDLAAPGTDCTVALVEVAIARDVGRAVASHAARLSDAPGYAVRFTPTNGASQMSVEDASWAISAAWEVGEHLRAMHDNHGVRHFHLYVAAPADWCVLLGHTLNAVGKITVHQRHPKTGAYVPACALGAVESASAHAGPASS